MSWLDEADTAASVLLSGNITHKCFLYSCISSVSSSCARLCFLTCFHLFFPLSFYSLCCLCYDIIWFPKYFYILSRFLWGHCCFMQIFREIFMSFALFDIVGFGVIQFPGSGLCSVISLRWMLQFFSNILAFVMFYFISVTPNVIPRRSISFIARSLRLLLLVFSIFFIALISAFSHMSFHPWRVSFSSVCRLGFPSYFVVLIFNLLCRFSFHLSVASFPSSRRLSFPGVRPGELLPRSSP